MTRGRNDGSLVLTSEELRGRPDLTAIDGSLYDLSKLSPEHPGGDIVRAAGAYDASALFHSMHPGRQDSPLLDKCRVGTHARGKDDPVYAFDTPFAKDLLKSVRKAMAGRSWYAPTAFWLRVLVIALGTLFCEYKWATTGALMWGALVGFWHAQIGLSVQHDASHGALSRNPYVNGIFMYGADWIGNSRWIWFQQHILWHHPHTNHVDLDPDASSAEPFVVFADYSRAHSTRPKTGKWSSFQDLFLYGVLYLYGPSVVFNPYVITLRHNDHVPASISDVNEFMGQQKIVTWLWRAFYVARAICLPYVNGAPWWLALFLVNVVTGIFLTTVFVVSHNFEGSDRDPSRLHDVGGKKREIDWYKAQVETSCSYGGTLAMLLTGGLNMQIEHHVFPRLCSWYYPGSVGRAVRECCERHGVRYTYFPSFLSNTRSMLRYVRKVGVIQAAKGISSSL